MDRIKRIKALTKSFVVVGFAVVSLCCINAQASINASHTSNIKWDRGYRWVDASTQAYSVDGQGRQTKIGSYTRARFERTWFQGGGSYGDSGRCWNVIQNGKSYATSSRELYNFLESGVAKSYWGT